MVDDVNLALYLICHHGNLDEALKDAQVIQRVSIEKNIPITYFFSGIELNTLAQNRGRIHDVLWMDLVGAINHEFINPRWGYDDPHKSELGIMPFHHIPLVHPFGEHILGEYFEGFLKDDISWSKNVAEQSFNRTPVTIHPPDGVYSPAAAHALKQIGMDTAVVSGEFLGDNRHAKGVLYWASGLRHLVRTNDIQPNSAQFHDAHHFVDAVQSYGYENDISFVVAGCDVDEFNGMRGLGLHDGIARLCNIGDEAYKRGVKMVNCNAASHWNLYQADITDVWRWNNVYAMIYSDGGLGWLEGDRNALVGHMIWLAGERYRQGWDVRGAKDHIRRALDIALRNRYCCYDRWLTDYFYGNINVARSLLRG